MKSFYCRSGNVFVEETGAPRIAFAQPTLLPVQIRAVLSDRRARSRAIRQQNRDRTGKL